MKSQVNVVIPPLSQPYTYAVPEHVADIEVGDLVEVPLGSRKASGFVVERVPALPHGNSRFEIKPVIGRIGSAPCFRPDQLTFFSWIAEYYNESLANVLDTAVPKQAPQKFIRYITLIQSLPEDLRLGKLQKSVIDELTQSADPVSYAYLIQKYKGAAQTLKRLEERGIISIISEEIVDHYLAQSEPPEWAKSSVELSDDQSLALKEVKAALSAEEFKTFLLHGVTGSGKTEVYIEAIKEVLAKDQGALVVVPEIALTPQLVDRFRARLGNNIAVLHSALNRRVRWDSWRALLEGRCRVAIGARSGIFAPVPNLGLIIVDEEHDPSFKQNEGFRYNARDLALVRGKFESCAVVLGSATPSLESYYHSITGKYRKLSLSPQSGYSANVEIQVVDLGQVKPWEMAAPNVSPQLQSAIAQTLERKEQIFVLYNRRGFASYLQHITTKEVLSCPNCSVTLTYHRRRNLLVCHHCATSAPPPEFYETAKEAKRALEVQEHRIQYVLRGAGTEKIHEELIQLFPHAEIERLDRDSVQDIERYKDLLSRVRQGKIDILVGTQMIAKGHDLPGVTLVGIADCDVGLHMPDFRASERIFHLLTQAAGRAGRGSKPGRVILQTRVPHHLSITATRTQDYISFARFELSNRQKLRYPPFVRLLRVVAASSDSEAALQLLTQFRVLAQDYLSTRSLEGEVLGPAPAPLEKLKTLWRWHLLLKSPSSQTLIRIVKLLKECKYPAKRIRLIFDIDPQDMM